ncbi:MAG TPA: precorrin-6y C5,15-methyltransferase (decarboxylating) subunit CbiE [Thermodesulfobacteriota bacterium]|nr:precorrin-6y C5,15-methyltransferase (decarboxylating) subunit CbiE [Thermodesulfobacteriota bacterium]
MIYVIGMGIEGRVSLLERPMGIIKRADLVVGVRRHLAQFPEFKGKKVLVTSDLAGIERAIKERTSKRSTVAVLSTGDPLLFGIGSFIIKKFGRKGVEIIPNVSTAQEAFARIKEEMNGVRLLSVHGQGAGLEKFLEDVSGEERVAVFTDPENPPSKICRALLKRGVSTNFRAFVCEDLGGPGESVTRGTLASIARKRSFAPLNVLVLLRDKEAAGKASAPFAHDGFGIPDALFSHSSGMITKEEIRVVALSKLRLAKNSVVWDIGSGCGSVAVEAARIASSGRVYAVEKDKKRLRDIKKNRKMFGTENLRVVSGTAPECLEGLESPGSVFIGGGGGKIEEILRSVSRRIKKGGPVVVNAVTLETAHRTLAFFKKRGWPSELVLLNVSRAKEVGDLSLLGAHNPVFVITGVRP